MRMAIGSDERTHVTDAVVDAREVGERVASGACLQGVLFCWTGTGVSTIAKVGN
jgi:ribose 5-phosphate isomerase RpiB